MNTNPLVSVRGLRVRYPERRRWRGRGRQRPAVDDVSFSIARGETFAFVGESGSGKTTVARALLRLVDTEAGDMSFAGVNLLALRGEQLRRQRRRMQVVFQDPYTSLNPRMTIGDAIAEGMRAHDIAAGPAATDRTAELLREVELSPDLAPKHPHELSGGQRQRVAIARALAVDPEFLVLDEAVSALDVTTQARILAVFDRLRTSRGLTTLFIAHNLAVVQQIANTVAVMYQGRIVETAPNAELFARPGHEYTRALLAAVPVPDPAAARRRTLR